MNVFLRYNRKYLEALKLVAQSWEAQGWKVRVYLPGSETKVGRNLLMDSRVVNFCYRPHHTKKDRRVAVYGRKGWQFARLVKFPSGKLDDVLLCGRKVA